MADRFITHPFITVLAASATLALAGCTSAIPRLPQDDGHTAQSILHAVQCELAAAVTDTNLKDTLASWAMRVKLELKGTGGLGATPTLTPVSSTAAVVPGAIPISANATNARRSIVVFDTAAALYDPGTDKGGKIARSCADTQTGGLGLKAWLAQSLDPVVNGPGTLNDLQYYADFTVSRSVGGALTIKTPIAELKLDKPSASLGSEDHLTITFTRLPSTMTTFALLPEEKLANDITAALDARQAELDKENEPVIQLKPGDSLVVQ